MRDRENESDVPAPITNGSEAPTNNGRWVASYKPSFGEGDGGIDGEVKKIWAMLRRRRLTLAVSTIIIGAVVAGGFWILPNRFRSTVTILVETPGQTESTGLTILERVWQGANVETEVHLMTSSSVVMPIVDEFELNAKLIDANDDDRRPQELFSQFSVEPDAPGGDYSLALGTDGEFTVRAADTDSLLLSAGQGELVFFEVAQRFSFELTLHHGWLCMPR